MSLKPNPAHETVPLNPFIFIQDNKIPIRRQESTYIHTIIAEPRPSNNRPEDPDGVLNPRWGNLFPHPLMIHSLHPFSLPLSPPHYNSPLHNPTPIVLSIVNILFTTMGEVYVLYCTCKRQ
jgi:hypothetical protein